LWIGVVVLSGLLLDDAIGSSAEGRLRLARLLAMLWASCGCVMVFYNVQRYAVGMSGDFWFLFEHTPWEGPLPSLICVILAAVGYFGVVICLLPGSMVTAGRDVAPI